jgi:hypothetical protein
MKRTTITLPDDLASAVEREARHRRIPVSQFAREALEARLGRSGPNTTRKLPFAGLGRSGHHSTARNIEEILGTDWADDRDR